MKAIVFSGYEDLAKAIGMKIFQWEFRHFPDGESYVRIIDPVPESITILCGLEHPDTKIVPLILSAPVKRVEMSSCLGARSTKGNLCLLG